MKLKESLKILAIPIAFIFIYLIIYFLWKFFELPSQDQMIVIVEEWFSKYGLLLVFIGALVEGLLLVGNYFPGGFIIFLGVISVGKNIPRAAEVVIVVCIAFFISYTLNYMLGKHGWYKLFVKFGLSNLLEKYKDKLTKQGLNAIFFTYWLPNLASLTATSAGILKVPLRKFSIYSAIGIIIWSTFWGTLIYLLGQAALEIIGLKFVVLFFLVWIGIIVLRHFIKNRQANPLIPLLI